VLETIDDLKAWAPKILEQVVLDRNMPVGNDTGMTEEQRGVGALDRDAEVTGDHCVLKGCSTTPQNPSPPWRRCSF
jgi:hypothetical protein